MFTSPLLPTYLLSPTLSPRVRVRGFVACLWRMKRCSGNNQWEGLRGRSHLGVHRIGCAGECLPHPSPFHYLLLHHLIVSCVSRCRHYYFGAHTSCPENSSARVYIYIHRSVVRGRGINQDVPKLVLCSRIAPSNIMCNSSVVRPGFEGRARNEARPSHAYVAWKALLGL